MNISTLVPDIYTTILRKDGWFNEEISQALANTISKSLSAHLGGSARYELSGTDAPRLKKPTLRLSQMGPRCPKALWYSIHHPELGEALPAWAEIKFSFGHVLEALAITLAKASGHVVTGEQDAVQVDGIVGHRDCVIDGCIVDVKSSSSRGMEKFRRKGLEEDDPFGYLDQLDGYLVGSLEDPLVTVKDKAYLLAIDKQLGHMVLYEHTARPARIIDRVKLFKEIVGRSSPPACDCKSIPDGKSGNLKLDVKASYNAYKHCCNPRIRTFLYASGPVYLTHVERKPDVPEITREGQLVTYH